MIQFSMFQQELAPECHQQFVDLEQRTADVRGWGAEAGASVAGKAETHTVL